MLTRLLEGVTEGVALGVQDLQVVATVLAGLGLHGRLRGAGAAFGLVRIGRVQ